MFSRKFLFEEPSLKNLEFHLKNWLSNKNLFFTTQLEIFKIRKIWIHASITFCNIVQSRFDMQLKLSPNLHNYIASNFYYRIVVKFHCLYYRMASLLRKLFGYKQKKVTKKDSITGRNNSFVSIFPFTHFLIIILKLLLAGSVFVKIGRKSSRTRTICNCSWNHCRRKAPIILTIWAIVEWVCN